MNTKLEAVENRRLDENGRSAFAMTVASVFSSDHAAAIECSPTEVIRGQLSQEEIEELKSRGILG